MSEAICLTDKLLAIFLYAGTTLAERGRNRTGLQEDRAMGAN